MTKEDTREVLTIEELELYAWNDQATYKEGLYRAKHAPHREDYWIGFLEYAIARYSSDVLKKYRGAKLPLELWGVAAERFRVGFVELSEEIKANERIN